MSYGKIILLGLILMGLFSITCKGGGTPPPLTEQGTYVQVTAKPEGPVAGSWEERWEAALKEAKKEGTVVALATSVAPALKESIPLFKKKYGINLELMTGRGAEASAKLLQERAVGVFVTDIFISGLNTIYGAVKKSGALDPLEPALMLPEVTDPMAWYGGKFPWADKERMVLTFYAYPTAMMGINADFVKPGDISSYYDLLDPRWKGRIVMNDPTVTGTAFNGFSSLLYNKVLELDFFRQLVKQEPALLRDQRLQVDWLARGRYPLALWPRSVHMSEYQQAGAPLMNVTAKEGTYLSVDGGGLVLLNRAPHPNAARILINWILSKEGQFIMQKVLQQQSAREDIGIEGADPVEVRKPGEKYYIGANSIEEWILQEQEKYLDLARETFSPLLR